MKKLLAVILITLLPFIGRAQAHLGATESEIKSYHQEVTFKIGYTDKNVKYLSGDMAYGTFLYYFDSNNEYTNYCVQVPYDLKSLNALVEIYNKKYVIVSNSSWKGYLEGGVIMFLNLTYNKEYDIYVFSYEL